MTDKLTDEEMLEIQTLEGEIESLIKHGRIDGDKGPDNGSVNIGAASSMIRARCRKILRIKGTPERVIKTLDGTTQLMKAAGIQITSSKEKVSD